LFQPPGCHVSRKERGRLEYHPDRAVLQPPSAAKPHLEIGGFF